MRIFVLLALALLCPGQRAVADDREFNEILDKRFIAIQQDRWSDAIILTEKLIVALPPDDHVLRYTLPADIGEFRLNLLDFVAAEKVFRDHIAAGKDKYGDASLGLARARAAQGKYDKAIESIMDYASGRVVGCGTCADARRLHGHICKSLWQYAQLPKETAVTKLESVSKGDFKSLNGQTIEHVSLRKMAAREAQMILADILRRDGHATEAKALYLELAKERDKLGRLAKAYLSQNNLSDCTQHH